jgi:hypothetical protein
MNNEFLDVLKSVLEEKAKEITEAQNEEGSQDETTADTLMDKFTTYMHDFMDSVLDGSIVLENCAEQKDLLTTLDYLENK